MNEFLFVENSPYFNEVREFISSNKQVSLWNEIESKRWTKATRPKYQSNLNSKFGNSSWDIGSKTNTRNTPPITLKVTWLKLRLHKTSLDQSERPYYPNYILHVVLESTWRGARTVPSKNGVTQTHRTLKRQNCCKLYGFIEIRISVGLNGNKNLKRERQQNKPGN